MRQNLVQWIPQTERHMICVDQSEASTVLRHYGALETTCFGLLWAGPFNFTISNNSANTLLITSVLGLSDGKLYTLYNGTITVTLHKVLPKSQPLPNPALGGCAGAQLRQILHSCTGVSETCQLLRTPTQALLRRRSTSGPYNRMQIALILFSLRPINDV